jgi:GDPmannose 4,6-dehydratase
MSFKEIGVELAFTGEGIDEVGTVVASINPDFPVEIGKQLVSIDSAYFRPTEVELLIGDPTKSKTKLGWIPKYDLEALCSEMVAADIELFQRDQLLKNAGYEVKNQYE